LFNNGAYADYMRIPSRIVVENMLEVPHSVDDQSAALAEPLACVLRGIHEMEVRTGDTAAVIGCGPIGVEICPHAFPARSARDRPGAAFSAAGCRQALGRRRKH